MEENFSQQQHKKTFSFFKCWMYVNDSHLFICAAHIDLTLFTFCLRIFEMMILYSSKRFFVNNSWRVMGWDVKKGTKASKRVLIVSMRMPLICKFFDNRNTEGGLI